MSSDPIRNFDLNTPSWDQTLRKWKLIPLFWSFAIGVIVGVVVGILIDYWAPSYTAEQCYLDNLPSARTTNAVNILYRSCKKLYPEE